MPDVSEANHQIRNLEGQGYRLWTDHPGYVILELNLALATHRLRIETLTDGSRLWYRIVPL